ncbi:MAG: sensor histidine kinase [Hornefia sp.]|nr:sensor histidine kinase [Hornefia sp.]
MEKDNKLFGYVKSVFPVVLCAGLCVFTFGVTFYIANLKMEYFGMAAELVVVFLILYIIVGYVLYERKLSLKEKLSKLRKENKKLRIEKASERKDLQEYFLTWVHQIKTPITVSKLLLEEMEDAEGTEALKKEMLYIENYADMALSYLKLINHERDMDIASVKLGGIIKPILKKYSRLFIDNHIRLIYEDKGDEVITDAKWFSVLLEQIISNAVKYTKNGMIQIKFDENENSLAVIDEGIGIRSEDMPKIFDKGYSGFNGRLNQKSSGIGLYLAKQIARKLLIKIDVKSEVGKGSSFFIIFNGQGCKNEV